eukprot:scaffold2063_cov401-Prasinococcus_capsulatus_cf.AAC.21
MTGQAIRSVSWSNVAHVLGWLRLTWVTATSQDEVEKYGTLCVYNPAGLTKELWAAGLKEFNEAKKKGYTSLGFTVMGQVWTGHAPASAALPV